MTTKFYTNLKNKNNNDLDGTITLITYKEMAGIYAGEVIPKGSEIVVSGLQVRAIWDVIKDGNCTLNLVVDMDSTYNDADQFQLFYTEDFTNFGIQSVNC